MSARALGLGLATYLSSAGLGLDDSNCRAMPDGRPTANCGQLFIAVHPGNWSNSSNLNLDERFNLSVTVTVRAGFAPHDRVGTEVTYGEDGVLAWADKIEKAVHRKYHPTDQANQLLAQWAGDATAYGFSEPLLFLDASYLGVKGPDWFTSDDADGDDVPSGVAVELRFGKARRLQPADTES